MLPSPSVVALRKESVDRNMLMPSMRGRSVVALRKESVDRNGTAAAQAIKEAGRSPQGERG